MDSNINNFKEFVRNNTFLIGLVRDHKKSWQELYELYDLYGEDENIWDEFLKDNSTTSEGSNNYFGDLVKMAKNIDVNKVQDGISSLQKTLSLFGELFVNKDNKSSTYNPRPLYRKFDD